MIHIVTHILPQEIDHLENLLIQLKKCSKYIKREDYFLEVILNNKFVDWDKSIIKENYFINKFNSLKKLTESWCDVNFEISDGTILGCNDIRRRALRNSESDYIMYLDADNVFSETFLFYIKNSCVALNLDNQYNILTPQTTRMWDNTWDIITNKKFLMEEASHENYLNRDPYNVINNCVEVELIKIDDFKFAGWGTCIPTKIKKIIDIPDSLGSYGLDDTFIMYACQILKLKGNDINQYVINGEIIIENNKFRTDNYKDYISSTSKKDEFLEKAKQNFQKELLKYAE